MAVIASVLSRSVRNMTICAVIASGLSLVSSAVNRQNCSSRADCSRNESCCDSVCVASDDCLVHSCSDDSHCKPWENCCDEVCSMYCISFNVDIVIASVVGSCILLCFTSLCFYFTCCRPRRQPQHDRVIIGETVAAKTFTTRCATQGDAPYRTEVVPGYTPHYIEYMQYINNGQEHEPPPPYNSATNKRSGGVDVPQKAYTALQHPSTCKRC